MPVINYLANYEYISQELCENKDNPEMHCNGKCYLYKQTRAIQEEQEEKDATISEVLSLQYTTSEAFTYELLSFEEMDQVCNFTYSENEYSVFSDCITPPPKSFV